MVKKAAKARAKPAGRSSKMRADEESLSDDVDDDDALFDGFNASDEEEKVPGKAEKKDTGKSKECFVLSCRVARKGKGKFCQPHRKTTDSMMYQAKEKDKQGGTKVQVESLLDLLADPNSCEDTIEEFRSQNPEGAYGKNPAVDWCEMSKVFKNTTSTTHRGREVETTREDFWEDNQHKWDEERLKLESRCIVRKD